MVDVIKKNIKIYGETKDKEKLLDGEIGDIIHIHSTENVSYHHTAYLL